MKFPPIHYHDYLDLDSLLKAQNRRSEQFGDSAHDEMLFIITHQTYELWFKQILFELESVCKVFQEPQIDETKMGLLVARIERVSQIQNFLIGQIDILETMTPMDFLDFRDYLFPASGFQSHQWRKIEVLLGLKEQHRVQYNQSPVTHHLKQQHQDEIKQLLQTPSLLECLERWLERTPFLSYSDFDFKNEVRKSFERSLESDIRLVQKNPNASDEEKNKNLAQLESAKQTMNFLTQEKDFEELRKQGHFRMSQKAVLGGLFILTYRDLPALQMPFRLIQALMNLDEAMTQWRYRHALMAHRMLGKKMGTGGSSGHDYLKNSTEKHKVFSDFFNLSTFLLPRSQIPQLPDRILKIMNYGFTHLTK